MRGTSQGRVAGTEEGKSATVPAWPGGGRCRAHGSEGFRGLGCQDNRRPQGLIMFPVNLSMMGPNRL